MACKIGSCSGNLVPRVSIPRGREERPWERGWRSGTKALGTRLRHSRLGAVPELHAGSFTQPRLQGLLLDDFQNGGSAILKIVEEKALGTRLEFYCHLVCIPRKGAVFLAESKLSTFGEYCGFVFGGKVSFEGYSSSVTY